MPRKKKKKLDYFDEDTCNLCNNGLIKEVDIRVNKKGVTPTQACHEMASDIRWNTGDEIYTAEQLRNRYRYYTKKRNTEKIEEKEAERKVIDEIIKELRDEDRKLQPPDPEELRASPRSTQKLIIDADPDTRYWYEMSKRREKAINALGLRPLTELSKDVVWPEHLVHLLRPWLEKKFCADMKHTDEKYQKFDRDIATLLAPNYSPYTMEREEELRKEQEQEVPPPQE